MKSENVEADKFVVFKPKNDPWTVYIARESLLPKCKEYDEKVFLKPAEMLPEDERNPPKALYDSDIGFINKHSTLVRFDYDPIHECYAGTLINGGCFTEEVATAICEQLNNAMNDEGDSQCQE